MSDKTPTIGLFGTCDKSVWRDKFLAAYDKLGFNYFNPNKADWKPEDAKEEARHLASDSVLLFPVTDESFGFASLGEIGFAVVSAIKAEGRRTVIVRIDKQVQPRLKEANPEAAKHSNNARAIVLAHLAELDLPYVYLVEDDAQMLEKSIEAYRDQQKTTKIKKPR